MKVCEISNISPIFEKDKQFILNHQFIGYVGNERHGKVIRAIEMGTGDEVAIRFVKTADRGEKDQVLAQYLIRHQAFSRIRSVKALRNVNAYVCDYIGGLSLAEHLECRGSVGTPDIIKIFEQMLDVVCYLHSYNIAYNGTSPGNIILTDKMDVRISSLKNAVFYDSGDVFKMCENDIFGLGKLLLFMLSGGKAPYDLWGAEDLRRRIAAVDALSLRHTLEYIFGEKKPKRLSELCEINGLKWDRYNARRDPVVVLDLLVADELAGFGVDKAHLSQNVNDPRRKEHFMYMLCEQRIAGEMKVNDELLRMSLKENRASCMVCNMRQRQRELLDRKYSLFLNKIESSPSCVKYLFCSRYTAQKITFDLLRPWDDTLRFGAKEETQLHRIDQTAIRVEDKNAVLEFRVVVKGCLWCFGGENNGRLTFDRISGRKYDFICLVINVLDEIATKGRIERAQNVTS